MAVAIDLIVTVAMIVNNDHLILIRWQVKSREAALEKLLKSEDYIKRPPFQGTAFKFRFPPGPRSAGDLATIEHLSHGYGGNLLFDDTSLEVGGKGRN